MILRQNLRRTGKDNIASRNLSDRMKIRSFFCLNANDGVQLKPHRINSSKTANIKITANT